jgi:DNA recombination protein RmuC
MLYALIIISIALLAAAGACVWLLAERKGLIAQRDQLTREADELTAQNTSYSSELNELRTQIAVAKEKQQAAQQMFDHAQQQLREVFKSSASDAMKQSNEQFLVLAEQKLQPLRKLIEQYNTAYQQIELGRRQEYGSLKVTADRLQTETTQLVTALRRPEVRGRWGEVQLRRIVELAGMTDRCDFEEQVTLNGEAGRLRPDLIVHLPNGRTVIVDAKTVLDAFLDSTSTADADQRRAKLAQHVDQINKQVANLSGKAYLEAMPGTPDFVILFLRVESALYAAMEIDNSLLERAMAKKVIIATPTTLIALLKAVAMGWSEQQLADSARQIGELGRELHKRLCTALEHFEKLGHHLQKTVEKYNQFRGSMDASVLPAARRFDVMGAASAKSLPESLIAIELMPNTPPGEAPHET